MPSSSHEADSVTAPTPWQIWTHPPPMLACPVWAHGLLQPPLHRHSPECPEANISPTKPLALVSAELWKNGGAQYWPPLPCVGLLAQKFLNVET